VFVIAIFDPVLANRCPNPLLPVAESLPGHLAKSKPKRKSAASETATSIGTEGETVGGLTVSDLVKGQTSHQALEQNFLQVVEDRQPYTPSSFAQYKEEDMHAVATLRAGGGDLGGGNEVLIAEPYVKSSRAQTSEDSETWVPGEVNPTLNSFDVGDTRATTAIVEPVMLNYQGSKGNSVTSEDGLSFSLNAMHGHDVHVVTEQMENRPVKEIVGSLQARVTATNHESIRDGHAIVEEMTLIDGQRVGDVRIYTEPVQTLGARMGTGGNNVPMLAYGIQGNVVGRQDHNGPAGKGHTEEGDPMFTLTSTDVHAIAYPIDTRNALRDPEKYDAQNRQGLGIGADGDPMATLTSAHVNGVAYGAEPTMAVRRLTPLECERLMGWPDDHTRYKADGTEQADTHRYKQCGNGVASPVAQWIAKHILNI
jgi:hypothetical protein